MSEDLKTSTALTLTMPDHAGRGHADLGASSIKRWTNCYGSVELLKGRPRVSSAAADRGTAVHELGEICFKSGRDCAEYIDRKVGGHIVDEEMAAGGQVYVDFMKSMEAQYPNGMLLIEQRVSLAPMKPPDDMFGTTDTAMVAPPFLHVGDYKNGTQVVEVTKNGQGRYYLLGIWCNLPREIRDQITTCRVTIIQPNAYHRDGPIRTEEFSIEELKEWSKGMFEHAKRALAPNAQLKAGDWCRESFCDARGDCPAYAKLALQVACDEFDEIDIDTVLSKPTLPIPLTLTPEQIGIILQRAEFFADWIGQVKEHAFHRLNRGEPVPGWKLVAKRATRCWNRENEVIGVLEIDYGLDDADIYVRKLISPAVAEKKLGKKKFAAIEHRYVVKVSSGAKLAPETDKAPAVIGVSAASEFDEITEG